MLNNILLRQVLQKFDASGRLLKLVVELSEFDIHFKIRAAIKGQALANYVPEFSNVLEMEEAMEPIEPPTWNLLVDNSTGEASLGVCVVLVAPKVTS